MSNSVETQDSDNVRSSQSSRSLESISSISQENVIRLAELFKPNLDQSTGTRKLLSDDSRCIEPMPSGKIPSSPSRERLSVLMEQTLERIVNQSSGTEKSRDLKATLDPDSDLYKLLFESDIPQLPTNIVREVVDIEEQERLSALYFETNPPIFCHKCSENHDRYYGCPNIPCSICYKDGHVHHFCPYKSDIPKWADFDSKKYHVICGSCNFSIDVSTWLCTYCYTPMPMLDEKYCELCKAIEDHITVECPNDEAGATLHKSKLNALIENNRNRSVSPYFVEYLTKWLASESDA